MNALVAQGAGLDSVARRKLAAAGTAACLVALGCGAPAVEGATVMRAGYRAPQTRSLARYRLTECRDATGTKVGSREMRVELAAAPEELVLFVDRAQTNSLWFERGTRSLDALHFQAVLRSPGVAPTLWDFRFAGPSPGGAGTLVVASKFSVRGEPPIAVAEEVIRWCTLAPMPAP